MDEQLVLRRLLLAKEFFLYADERAHRHDAINKMMAVHHFHLAVEIVLKAVLLKYQIRTDKTLNIDFETMMSEIDSKGPQKLPFRQELRTLNQQRGIIQHQAVEPSESAVQDFRAITRFFLEAAFRDYFKLEFSELSRLSMVADKHLHDLLAAANRLLVEERVQDCAIVTVGAFQLASQAITDALPLQRGASLGQFALSGSMEPIAHGLTHLAARIGEVEQFAALVGTGVALQDIKRMRELPLHLELSITGAPIVHLAADVQFSAADLEWSIHFVIDCVLLWQQQGLQPMVSIDRIVAVENLLSLL